MTRIFQWHLNPYSFLYTLKWPPRNECLLIFRNPLFENIIKKWNLGRKALIMERDSQSIQQVTHIGVSCWPWHWLSKNMVKTWRGSCVTQCFLPNGYFEPKPNIYVQWPRLSTYFGTTWVSFSEEFRPWTKRRINCFFHQEIRDKI